MIKNNSLATDTHNLKFTAASMTNIAVMTKVSEPLIDPPENLKTSSPTNGGGGGGCSINPNAKFNGDFYLMLLLAILIQTYRRKIKFKCSVLSLWY